MTLTVEIEFLLEGTKVAQRIISKKKLHSTSLAKKVNLNIELKEDFKSTNLSKPGSCVGILVAPLEIKACWG